MFKVYFVGTVESTIQKNRWRMSKKKIDKMLECWVDVGHAALTLCKALFGPIELSLLALVCHCGSFQSFSIIIIFFYSYIPCYTWTWSYIHFNFNTKIKVVCYQFTLNDCILFYSSNNRINEKLMKFYLFIIWRKWKKKNWFYWFFKNQTRNIK